MANTFEYMIVYRSSSGQRAGLFKTMNKDELDKVINELKSNGCFIEKIDIIRRSNQ